MEEDHNNDGIVRPDGAITRDLFLEWRSPRYGTANPQRMINAVWEWLITSNLSAYAANEEFGGPSARGTGPCWCFNRVGQSSTELKDGRIVLIAGEHEDFYDPDFFIYNDVVVKHPDGALDIYGYPKDVFPPTDFHTATLVDNRIVIVGSLGYAENRKPGFTQVYSLDLNSFAITPVECTGQSPGWLHGHSAVYHPMDNAIVVAGGLIQPDDPDLELLDNIDEWTLHLGSLRWDRLTERNWPRWDIIRADRKPNVLWDMRQLEFFRSIGLRGDQWGKEHAAKGLTNLQEQLGFEPDLDLLTQLYNPPVSHDTLPQNEDEYSIHRISVDGVIVRYVEDIWHVRVTIEGELPPMTADMLASDVLNKLAALERRPYELRRL